MFIFCSAALWAAAGRLEKSFSKLAEQSVKQLCECVGSFFFSFKVYTALNFLSSGLFVSPLPFSLANSKRSRKWLQMLHVFWPQQTAPWKPLLAPSTFWVTTRKTWVSQVFYLLKYTADEENQRYFNTLSLPRSPESFLIWDIGRSPSVRWWGPNIRHRDGGPSRVSSCLNTPQCGESGWLREICLGEVHWWDVCSAAGAADEGSGGAVLLLLKASIFHHMVENRLQERRRSEKRRQESRQQGSYVILTWNDEQSWCEGSSPTVLSLGWGLVESADIDMKTVNETLGFFTTSFENKWKDFKFNT